MSKSDPAADRPFWLSPLGPIILSIVAVVLLLHDGLKRYEVLYRKSMWEQVPAMPARVSVPYRRSTVKVGLSGTNKAIANGKKSALSYEEQGRHKGKKRAPQRTSKSNALNKNAIYEKKVIPDRIYSKYEKRGTGMTYKVKRWYVKLAFKYSFKGKIYSVYDDKPSFSFDSRGDAEAFLNKHAGKWPIKAWVNPSNPKEATAFLIYDGWIWIQLGAVLVFVAFLWAIVAVMGGKQYVQAEKERAEMEAQEEPLDEEALAEGEGDVHGEGGEEAGESAGLRPASRRSRSPRGRDV